MVFSHGHTVTSSPNSPPGGASPQIDEPAATNAAEDGWRPPPIAVCRYARECWWQHWQCRGCPHAELAAFAAGLPREIDGLAQLAVGETVILLHLPLPLVGPSIVMWRERHQNDGLADG